jgi:putative peptidoglycan lipid II flippase
MFFVNMPGLRLPQIAGIELGLGAVGLTASAGLAGWIEFLCLRFALKKKIGSADVPFNFIARVWAAALVSAVVALSVEQFALDGGALVLRFIHYNFEPLLVLATFGLTYLIAATLLRVEETKLITRRLKLSR